MLENEKFLSIINAIKDKAAEILPKGSRVALFGSRARGDYRPDSDWDLQILIPGEEKLSWDLWDEFAWPFTELGFEYHEEINPRLYSFSGWFKRKLLPFYHNVERDSVTIFQS